MEFLVIIQLLRLIDSLFPEFILLLVSHVNYLNLSLKLSFIINLSLIIILVNLFNIIGLVSFWLIKLTNL